MSLKAKIITKIKEKVKAEGGYNLSNARINGLADKIDTRVDTEEAIDAEIDSLNELFPFKEMASLDDAKRNADKKAAEDADKGKEAGSEAEKEAGSEGSDDNKGKDEMPPWFKAHSESQNKIIESLTSKITAFEQGTVVQSRRQQLEAKLKDAPEKFKARTLRDFDRLRFDSDDEFNSYQADIEQDIAEEIQANAEAGAVGPRASGIGGAKLKDDEVSPAMKEIMAERKAAAEAAK